MLGCLPGFQRQYGESSGVTVFKCGYTATRQSHKILGQHRGRRCLKISAHTHLHRHLIFPASVTQLDLFLLFQSHIILTDFIGHPQSSALESCWLLRPCSQRSSETHHQWASNPRRLRVSGCSTVEAFFRSCLSFVYQFISVWVSLFSFSMARGTDIYYGRRTRGNLVSCPSDNKYPAPMTQGWSS